MLSKLSIFSKGAGVSHADDVVERTSLPSNVVKSLESISGWTCERRRSDRHDAREDIKVFNSAGDLIYLGRNFDGRTISFWKP